MNKQELKDFLSRYDTPLEKAQALQDASDGIEKQSYTRNFTTEELSEKKHHLSNVVVAIKDIQTEQKEAAAAFKKQLKEPLELKDKLTTDIKRKAEDKTEECFKFLSPETKTAFFYSPSSFELVFMRPMLADEFQSDMFKVMRIDKDGTND